MKRASQRFASMRRWFLNSLWQQLFAHKRQPAGRAGAMVVPRTFRQLEPRRVLSVNATLAAGVLDIAITDNSAAALLAFDATQMFVDADGDRAFDAGEQQFDFNAVTSLNVHDTSAGSFFWGDVFSLNSANIQTGSVALGGTINLGSLSINASQDVTFEGSTVVSGNLQITNAAQVTNLAGATLTAGSAQLDATSVNLGQQAGDTVRFGTLTANNAAAQVDLELDQAVNLGNITLDQLDLSATGSITQNAATTINTSTSLFLDANGADSDVILSGAINGNDGSVDIHADDAIQMNAASSINTGLGDVFLSANDDLLAGDTGDGILLQNGASISVGDAEIRLVTAPGGGSITLGHLVSTQATGTAITIDSADDILDGTTLDPAAVAADDAINLSAVNGTVFLRAVGDIGAVALGDIDVNTVNLLFDTGGAIQLTDTFGGLTISGASSATSGGAISANSPLTIAANVATGGSMVFTAGDSASAGDTLTIESGVTVTLNSAVGGTLSFIAGDDIALNGGQIVTTGGGVHSVIITADNEGAGVLDGDRGSVSEDGTGLVEVTTNSLTVSAADNITLDTAIDQLTASTTIAGSIVIRDAADLSIASVNSAGAVLISATGAIRGVTDDNIADIQAATTINLSAATGITGAGGIGRLDLADGSQLTATTTAGPIALDGLGALTLVSVSTGDGAVDVRAVGNLTATSVRTDATDSDTNDITLASTGGDVVVMSVLAGPNTGDVTITANGSITDGDAGPDNLDISGNVVELTATTGSIGAPLGNVFIGYASPLEVTATGDLTATALAGAIALDATVGGTLTLNSPTAWIQSNGDLDVSSQVFTVTNLALIADADQDGVGTLTIAPLIVINGDLRIEGADVVAAGGIELAANRLKFVSGRFGIAPLQDETILIHTNQFDGAVTGNFDIISRADNPLELIDLDLDNVAVQTRSLNASITLDADTTVTVSDDVIAGNDNSIASTGSIAFDVTGVSSNLVINDVILTDGGNIRLFADNDILFRTVAAAVNDLAVVTSIDGNITLRADANNAGATGVYLMNADSRVVAGRSAVAYVPDTGGGVSSPINLGGVAKAIGAEIDIQARGNVTLDSVESASNTSSSILVTSLRGGIVDGNGAGVNLTAVNSGALATLRAITGIGSADDLETNLFSVDALNQDNLPILATGQVRLHEVAAGGDLNIIAARNDADSGAVLIQVDDGQLIAGPVQTELGNILLRSVLRDVIINSTVTSQGGHISLRAGDDVLVNADVVTGNGQSIFVLAGNVTVNGAGLDGIIMADNTRMQSFAGVIVLQTQNAGDIVLGLLDTVDADPTAGIVSLSASRSVLAGAGDLADLNIEAGELRIETTSGTVGTNQLLSGTANLNLNAINTRVERLAVQSATGIYIQEENGLTITSVGPVNAQQVNFDNTLTAVNQAVLSDLRTLSASAPIKLQATTGSIVVQPGLNANGLGIEATGDVLLQTLASDGDIIVEVGGAILSSSGNISLVSADDIDLRAAATATLGSIFFRADNGNADPGFNGIRIAAPVTAAGNIRLSSAAELSIENVVQSTGGSIVLDTAGGDITQQANVLANAHIVANASGDYLMIPAATMVAGQNVRIQAGGDVHLNFVRGLNVAIDAGGDIIDDNLADLNVRAGALLMTAGGQIGDADLLNVADANLNAIDIELGHIGLVVDGSLAAQAAQGIYLQERSVAGSVIITSVAFSIAIAVPQANFNSTTTPQNTNISRSLEDVRGSRVKFVLDAASLQVTRGSTDDIAVQAIDDDILLDARNGDLTIDSQAIVTSGAGHTNLLAADTLQINGVVSTSTGSVFATATTIDIGGSIETTSGNVRVRATQDLSLSGQITSTSGSIGLSGLNIDQSGTVSTTGNVFEVATNDLTMTATGVTTAGNFLIMNAGNDITLGRVQALDVGVSAGRDILDGNAANLNVRADRLNMFAGRFIGGSDLPNIVSANDNAIDIQLGRMLGAEAGDVAAQAGLGIYLQETSASGTVNITNIAGFAFSFGVTQVNFNSSQLPLDFGAIQLGLEDLTAGGPIKFVLDNSSLVVTAGLLGTVGVSATDADILLDARGQGDLTINAGAEVSSGAGHMTLSAGDTLTLLGTLTTTTGHINLTAGNDVQIDNTLNVNTNLRIFAGRDVLINSPIVGAATSNLSIQAVGNIQQQQSVTAGIDALLRAGNDVNMAAGTSTQAGSTIIVTAGNDVNLQFLQALRVGVEAGRNIVDGNDVDLNIRANILSMQAGQLIGNADPLNAATANAQAIDIQLGGLAGFGAGILAAQAGTSIYLLESTVGGSVIVTNLNFAIDFDVQRVNFNSSRTALRQNFEQVREDLIAASHLKVVMSDGSLVVRRGLVDDVGVQTTTGDILLDARGGNLTIDALATVSSTSGAIDLAATNQLLVLGSVSTSVNSLDHIGVGTILGTATTINIQGAVTTSSGNIRLVATQVLQVGAAIQSATGDIALIAGTNLNQLADVTATSGSVLARASNDLVMGAVNTVAGTDALLIAGRDLTLGRVQGLRVGLDAGRDIIDGNDATVNVRANVLNANAGRLIGNADPISPESQNLNAIDLQLGQLAGGGVGVIAAHAGSGMYFEESTAGGNVRVDNVAAIDVTVATQQVNFNSTRTQVQSQGTRAALQDLVSDSGVIKVVMDSGSLTIATGNSVQALSGDILLDARGVGSDLTVDTGAQILGGRRIIKMASDTITTRGLVSGTSNVLMSSSFIDINAVVTSSGGPVILLATQDITLSGNVSGVTVFARAGRDVLQNSDIQATTAIVEAGRDVLMGANADIDAAGDASILAVRDARLGRVSGLLVDVEAGGNISDGNDTLLDPKAVNIVADRVRLSAGGRIGAADLGNVDSTQNNNALDLQHRLAGGTLTVAASSGTGMYLEEVSVGGGEVIVDAVTGFSFVVQYNTVNFNSTVSAAPAINVLRSDLEDLVSATGPVKLVVDDGSLTVRSGLLNPIGVSTTNGDILLDARGAGSNLTVAPVAAINSNTGHIQLSAENLLVTRGPVTTTGVLAADGVTTPSVLMTARNIEVRNTVQTVGGNVQLRALESVLITSAISSTSGNIGVIAGTSIDQQANITTTSGSVYIEAGTDYTLAPAASVSAGASVIMVVTGDIELGLITANRVGLQAGGNIIDVNATALNIQANELSMIAGGRIGNSDNLALPTVNTNAIDVQLGSGGVPGLLSARAGQGMYIRETSVNGLVAVDNVAAFNVSFNVQQVDFRSTTSNRTINQTQSALEDLIADNGPVKLVMEDGSLLVRTGVADNQAIRTLNSDGVLSGDHILLEARGAGHDLTIESNAAVISSGLLTMSAADQLTTRGPVSAALSIVMSATNIDIGATVNTPQFVEINATQDVLISADITADIVRITATRDVTQTADITTFITVVEAGRDIVMSPDVLVDPIARIDASNSMSLKAGRDVRVGQLTAILVDIEAGRDITDGNDTLINSLLPNIIADQIKLDAGGAIGASDLGNPLPTANRNAIDIQHRDQAIGTTLAARSTSGIYLQDVSAGGVTTVGLVGGFGVGYSFDTVNFNSTTTPSPVAFLRDFLEDLTSGAGPIKFVLDNSSLIVTGGTANALAVTSTSGDILLETRGAASDIQIAFQAMVSSASGNIAIISADDIVALYNIETTSGDIYLLASNQTVSGAQDGIVISGPVTAGGDVLLHSRGDIEFNQIISSTGGNVGLFATGDVRQLAALVANNSLVVRADGSITMLSGTASAATNGDLIYDADNDITLSLLRANRVGISSQTSILDGNGTDVNVIADSLSMIAVLGTIGQEGNANVSGQNPRAIDLQVGVVAAQAGEGIYLEELALGGDLTIGHVDTFTITLQVTRPDFRSSPSDVGELPQLGIARTSAQRDDVEASNGPIKIKVDGGSLTVTEGDDNDNIGVRTRADGNILLRASADIVTLSTAGIQSDSGHITLFAQDDIDTDSQVVTGGAGTIWLFAGNAANDAAVDGIFARQSIQSTDGDILLETNRNIRVANTITSTAGDIGLIADADNNGSGGIVLLSTAAIQTSQDVMLTAGQSLTMGANATVTSGDNILVDVKGDATLASLQAANTIAISAGGSVLDNNANAVNIDSQSASIRYGVTVGQAADAIDTNVTRLAIAGAATDSGIFVRQVAAGGSLIIGEVPQVQVTVDVREVTVDGNSAATAPQQRSATLAALSDISNGAGNIVLTVDSGSLLITDGVDADGIGIDTKGASITLIASAAIDEVGTAKTQGIATTHLNIDAGTFAHLHNTRVGFLNATVHQNSSLVEQYAEDTVAAAKGVEFLDKLGAARQSGNVLTGGKTAGTPNSTSYSSVADDFNYITKYNHEYALFIRNEGTLTVEDVQATALVDGVSPNVYIATTKSIENPTANLNITHIKTSSKTAAEGGVILNAGSTLSLTGTIETERTIDPTTQVIKFIHQPTSSLDATFYNGGQGSTLNPLTLTTTEFVLRNTQIAVIGEDYRTHVLQRVVLQFGETGEQGFVTFIGYADNLVQRFDDQGDVGIGALNASLAAMIAKPSGAASDAAIFQRVIPFAEAFLNSNQVLDTVAIVRRSSDFFFFDHNTADGSVQDLTFESQPILNVKSLGDRGTPAIPVDPVPLQFSFPLIAPLPTLINQVPLQNNPLPEIAVFVPRPIEVALYRVSFTDDNENGQPEQDELPSTEDVKGAAIVNEDEFDKKQDVKRRARVKQLDIETGGTASAQDIDKFKAEFLNDPEQPSGAYSIIQKDSNDKETVLEIFSLRDWPETIKTDQPVISPEPINDGNAVPAVPAPEAAKPEPVAPAQPVPAQPSAAPKAALDDHRFDHIATINDQSINGQSINDQSIGGDEPTSDPHPAARGKWETRLASGGVMAGALWLVRGSTNPSSESLLDAIVEGQTQEGQSELKFDRASRRARRFLK